MKKELKKQKISKNGIIYVAISLVAVLVFGLSVSANQSLKQLLANALADRVAPEIVANLSLDGEEQLGAISSGDIYQVVTFYDKFGYGDGRKDTHSFFKAITFTDATSTAVSFNSQSFGINDFYLEDMWLKIDGKATSSVRIAVTTSTRPYFDSQDQTILNEDAGAATLMRTLGNAFGPDGSTYTSETATSTDLNILKYPGTNTFVATQKMPVLIASTTNILVFATSTEVGAITQPGNTFNGTIYIIGREK